MERCFTNLSFSVLINEESEGLKKKNGRGIRQGDPFFPFVFTVFLESLSLLLTRAKDEGLLHGFAAESLRTEVTHLQLLMILCFSSTVMGSGHAD